MAAGSTSTWEVAVWPPLVERCQPVAGSLSTEGGLTLAPPPKYLIPRSSPPITYARRAELAHAGVQGLSALQSGGIGATREKTVWEVALSQMLHKNVTARILSRGYNSRMTPLGVFLDTTIPLSSHQTKYEITLYVHTHIYKMYYLPYFQVIRLPPWFYQGRS